MKTTISGFLEPYTKPMVCLRYGLLSHESHIDQLGYEKRLLVVPTGLKLKLSQVKLICIWFYCSCPCLQVLKYDFMREMPFCCFVLFIDAKLWIRRFGLVRVKSLRVLRLKLVRSCSKHLSVSSKQPTLSKRMRKVGSIGHTAKGQCRASIFTRNGRHILFYTLYNDLVNLLKHYLVYKSLSPQNQDVSEHLE